MEQYSVVVSPQCASPTWSSQQILQTIIVSLPRKSNRREHFKHRYALILGIVLILATSKIIVLNSVGLWTAGKRHRLQHYSYGHGYYVFPSIWTSIVVSITLSTKFYFISCELYISLLQSLFIIKTWNIYIQCCVITRSIRFIYFHRCT